MTLTDTTTYENPCTGNVLICTFGLPRSGKSTWARKTGLPIVCPDGIRLALTGKRWWEPIEHEVWATARTMVRALFYGGNKTIILDATNLTRKARDRFIPSPDCDWIRRFVVFNTSAEVCKERAARIYPELCEVIERFSKAREPIDEAVEGQIINPDPRIPDGWRA